MKNLLKRLVVSIITFEAKLVIKKYKPQIIAITGSVGKTSTKDAVFTVFSKTFYARKSQKSFNSEIGIPLTILGCPNGWNNPFIWLKIFWEGLILILFPNHYPKWIILEVGADRPGDIEKISRLIQLDVVVFTKMSDVPVHVEFFRSAEHLLEEKMSLLKSLKKDGVIVYNNDDLILKERISKVDGFKKISYGFEKGADIKASYYKIIYSKNKAGLSYPAGINVKVGSLGSIIPLNTLGTLGRHQVYVCLGALATAGAISQNINLVSASEALNSNYQVPPGRMSILNGVKDTLIIDDSYNSSPVALFEALSVLKEIKTEGRKIAVLGDMLELGKYSMEEHKKVGSIASGFVDFLFTVGIRARYIAEAAQEAGFPADKIIQFEADESRLAGKQLELLIQKGDIILVKGSQGIRMEKVVEEVMAEPMKKEELLVRQEKDWQKR